MRQTPIPSLTPVLRPSRDLCGITPEQFAALCRDLEPIWAAQRRVRLDHTAAADPRPRQRRTPVPAPSRCRSPPGYWSP